MKMQYSLLNHLKIITIELTSLRLLPKKKNYYGNFQNRPENERKHYIQEICNVTKILSKVLHKCLARQHVVLIPYLQFIKIICHKMFMKQYLKHIKGMQRVHVKQKKMKENHQIPIAYLPLNQKPLKMSKTKLNFQEELLEVADLFARS